MSDRKPFLLVMPFELNQALIMESRRQSDLILKRVSLNQVVNQCIQEALDNHSINDLLKREYSVNDLKDTQPRKLTVYFSEAIHKKLSLLSKKATLKTKKRITKSAIINSLLKEKFLPKEN
jgi:hypothetical protein